MRVNLAEQESGQDATQVGYIAFLDVLGFGNLIAEDRNGERLRDYQRVWKVSLGTADAKAPVKYVVFSDSIVLTTTENLQVMIRACSKLFGALIAARIPVRGAIAYGQFVRSVQEFDMGVFVAGRAL